MFKQFLAMTLTFGAAALSITFAATTAAFAFGGCVNSPENPTWILAGIGAAAAGAPWLRSCLKHRRKSPRP